jgi:hypothetical protein
MTNDDIAFLRQLADWHDRQARYLLLTVPAGQHDRGRFNFTAAARLSRLADEATMSRSEGACATAIEPITNSKSPRERSARPIGGPLIKPESLSRNARAARFR